MQVTVCTAAQCKAYAAFPAVLSYAILTPVNLIKMSDFLENRANYQVAKKPYQKRGIYYNRDGERIRYCSSSDGFNWFKWVDKPNPDGEFMVSWFYEKKPEDAGCKFHPIHGWIVTA